MLPLVEEFDALKAKYLEGFWQNMTEGIRDLEGLIGDLDFTSAQSLSHKLTGSAGIYGYDNLALCLRHLNEELLLSAPDRRKVDKLLRACRESFGVSQKDRSC